jgi:predicted PhzF superfamily epimerase YddE/YHI9
MIEGTPSRSFLVAQGIDMSRPSLLSIDIIPDAVRIGGNCLSVMSGTLTL